MNEELMLKCREEYSMLPVEEQTKYLAQLGDAYGQDFVDAFTSFMETGNFPKFAAQVTTTPEFPAGELKEIPGMANGYERTMEEVAASLNTEHAPVYEAIMSMGQELNAAPPVKQSEMMDQLASARGQEFSEAVYYTFKHPDFCEYIAREAQTFFDTLAGNFSQSRDQVSSLMQIGNFSETLSKGVLSYATKGKPGNFSILESVALLSSLARKDFSENGELAEAIMELGEGDVSPEGAETLAENIEQYADGDTADVPEQIQEIAAQAEDVPPTQQAEQADMSQRDFAMTRGQKAAALAGAGAAAAGAGYAGYKFIPGMVDRAKAAIANSYWGNKAAGAVAAKEAAKQMAANNVDLALAKEAGAIGAMNQKAIDQATNLSTNWAAKGAEAVNQRMQDASDFIAVNNLAAQKEAAQNAAYWAQQGKAAHTQMLKDKLNNKLVNARAAIEGTAQDVGQFVSAHPVVSGLAAAGVAAGVGAGVYGLKKLSERNKTAKAMKAAAGPDMSQKDFSWWNNNGQLIDVSNAAKHGYNYVNTGSKPYQGAIKELFLRLSGHGDEVNPVVQKVTEVYTPYAPEPVAGGVMGWAGQHPAMAGLAAAGAVGAGILGAKALANKRRAAQAGAFSEQDIATSQAQDPAVADQPTDAQSVDEQTVMREKEQNNAMLDAIIEKYKALQSEEAKAQMVEEMNQLLDPELVQYIIARAEGEDFSEGEEQVPPATPTEGIAPQEDPVEANSGDLDKYEELSKQLLGQYEENPIGKVVAAEAPVAVATLPEGAPVASTEGGTTMVEDYQREPVIDKYEELGLI